MAIDTKTSAVIVIDVLVTGGADAVYNPSPQEARVVNNSVRIVDAARAAGMPVIFACDAHIPGVDRELELWGEHGIAGMAVPHPALRAGTTSRDFIVPKRRYDAFFGTDLDLLLRELGVSTLIAVGEDSNICVMHTLAGAYYRGYETIVAEDATRTFLCGTQEEAIERWKKCYGSRVATTKEIVGELTSA